VGQPPPVPLRVNELAEDRTRLVWLSVAFYHSSAGPPPFFNVRILLRKCRDCKLSVIFVPVDIPDSPTDMFDFYEVFVPARR